MSSFDRRIDGGGPEWARQQIAYYHARAPEYDEAYAERMHLDDLTPFLDGIRIDGDVLELACGTGQWTRLLSARARSLTAIDAAPGMLQVARRRLAGTRTNFIEADLFSWQPHDRYDTVFFAFWLSHVPPHRLATFWATLRLALRPGGRVVFVDDSFAKRELEESLPDSAVPCVRRRLPDGSEHVAVKVIYRPTELASKVRSFGWRCRVCAIDRYHLGGVACPEGDL